MKYLIYGAGGIGGCLAAFLAQGGKDVSLIARGAHLEAIQKNGLVLETGHGAFAVPVRACEQEQVTDKPDVIFVCVKGYSLEGTLPTLKRLSDGHTIVIPLLNIYGTGARLQPELSPALVTDGCIYIAAEIKAPRHRPHERRHLPGGVRPPHAGGVPPGAEEVARDLNDCGIEGILSQNIQRDALMKFSVVSPMAACGIYHHIQVGGMQAPGQPREDFKALVAEIGALAQAMGFPFPEDPVARNLAIQDALDPDASTSLKRDLDAGKPSEVDGLIFEVVRLGRKYHVPTPMYDRVAAKLGFNLEE